MFRRRTKIFAAGMVTGPVVLYVIFHKRIGFTWNSKNVTLLSHTKALTWLAENEHIIDFKTPVGIFTLIPPKK